MRSFGTKTLAAVLLLAGGCRAHDPSHGGPPTNTAAKVPAQDLPELRDVDPIGAKELGELAGLYEPVLKTNPPLIRAGKLAEATQRLLDVVPEASRTATHRLYLGNILYWLDREQSFKLHLEALRQMPESAHATLEAAFELQRAGKSSEACPLFERYLRKRASHKVINALWAHCLLDTGNLQGAVDAWKRADHPHNHVAIDETISEVFGYENPWSIRARLIARAARDDSGDSLGALVRHDLSWPINWWNANPSFDLAREDLANHGSKLPADVRESLALLIEAAETHRSPSADLKKRLPAQLQTRAAMLPTQLLRGLVDYGLRGQMLTAKEAFDWLRPSLETRAFSPTGTAQDSEFLAALAEGNDQRLLDKADHHGWDKFKERRCAESFFLRAARSGKLTPDDPQFRAALELHPGVAPPATGCSRPRL